MVISPMTLNLKGEQGEGEGGGEDRLTLAILQEEFPEMMVYPPVQSLASLTVVSPLALGVKVEEVPTLATALEVADSDAAACSTKTNSGLDPTNPATKVG
jgi:hypothetical protein